MPLPSSGMPVQEGFQPTPNRFPTAMPALPPAVFVRVHLDLKWVRVPLLAAILLLGLRPAARADDTQPWAPVPPADLAQTQLAGYPDAPAAILFWNIEIDEQQYPKERKIAGYIRYKIFDPAKSANITRIADLTTSVGGSSTASGVMRARLTLPDGTSREFGKDAVQEKTVSQNGAAQSWTTRLFGGASTEVKERFLAIPGLKAGAILDIQVTEFQRPAIAWSVYSLQKELYPIRELTYVHRLSHLDLYKQQSYMVNDKGLQVESNSDKKQKIIRVTAHNLPPLASEPFSAPICDRALTVFCSYSAKIASIPLRNDSDYIQLDPKAGPWVSVATVAYMLENDCAGVTTDLKKLASQVVGNAPTETEKARRIHRYVADTFQRYLRYLEQPKPSTGGYGSWSLAGVAHFEDYPFAKIIGRDFLWLELGLYRAAGLDAQTVIVPDRKLMRFNTELVSEIFLHELATRVRADGIWRFSMPTAVNPLPFGELPWYFQDTSGLIAQANKQEFVRVPPLPAAMAAIQTTGEFTLAPDGSLTGHGQRSLTGSSATTVRAPLRKKNRTERIESIESGLKVEFPSATATVSRVDGVDDPEAPLTYAFDLNWSDYGVATKKRIIFRPSVFHGNTPSPFPAETRHNLVDFPYHWQEIDDLAIHVPEGYELESPSAPASIPRSDIRYKVNLAYAAPSRLLHLRREFSSELTYVQPANYPILHDLFARVARNDSHELILTRTKPAAGENTTKQAPATESASPSSDADSDALPSKE
jgi:hypothetical protein